MNKDKIRSLPVIGVTILLSPRMTDRILDSGCVGNRVVWGMGAPGRVGV